MTSLFIDYTIAIFGFSVTIAAFFGPGLAVPELQRQANYLRYGLLMNLIYLSSVMVESVFSGKALTETTFVMYLTNYMQYISLYMSLLFVMLYMGARLKEGECPEFNTRPYTWICLIPIALMIINMFNHMYFYIDDTYLYHRGSLFIVSQLIGGGVLLIIFGVFVRYIKDLSREDHVLMTVFLVVPFIAMIFQSTIPSINYMIVAVTACSLSITIMGIVFWNIKYSQRESELSQLEIAVRVGNMNPEDLEAILRGISDLCETDADRAALIIDHYADFLRKSMNDLSEIRINPFSEELEHLKNYLILVKMIHGDRLEVYYDIDSTDAKLPSLVLQKAALWMIQYVMPACKDVFTLTIHSDQTENGFLIELYEELGDWGFVERKQTKEERRALADIRQRVSLIRGAELIYESSFDTGNMIKILLNEVKA